jgi:G3E family GTPase
MKATDLKTPVTLIAGYLGAGKTTLINACLKTRGERKIAVLVNDFGDINIDAYLIESQTDTVLNLAGGCVCCTIGSDFMEALFELSALPTQFDHVLVETSGVALPKPIAQSIALSQSFTLDGIFVLADSETLTHHLQDVYLGDLVRQQLQQSDCVLLTKTELLSSARNTPDVTTLFMGPIFSVHRAAYSCDWLLGTLKEVASSAGTASQTRVKSNSPDAASWLTQPNAGARYALLGTSREASRSSTEVFESLAIEFELPLDLARISKALTALASGPVPMLLRAKGLVRDRTRPHQWQLLQMVGQRLSFTDFDPQVDRAMESEMALVLIGLRHEMLRRRAELSEFIAMLQE